MKIELPIEGFPASNVEGLLFVAGTWQKPTILRPNNFRRRVWAPALKAAGLPPYPPRILRSSHATLLAQLTTHPFAIQGRLRHSDPRVAHEYYTQYKTPMDAQVSRCRRWRRRTGSSCRDAAGRDL
jgi:integrase